MLKKVSAFTFPDRSVASPDDVSVLGHFKTDSFKIAQPILCRSHCKRLVILSILQFQAADNQLVFVHHQAFHNYFVFFIISESVSSSHFNTMTRSVYICENIVTGAWFLTFKIRWNWTCSRKRAGSSRQLFHIKNRGFLFGFYMDSIIWEKFLSDESERSSLETPKLTESVWSWPVATIDVQFQFFPLSIQSLLGSSDFWTSHFWLDSNFISRISKKFVNSRIDTIIRIYIENEPETRWHEVKNVLIIILLRQFMVPEFW